MYPTVEVRWFWPGEIPQPVLDWLWSRPVAPESHPARVDRYARMPAGMRETVGIKLREGRLEVKWRQQEPRVVRLAPGACGALEHWRKQTFLSGGAGGTSVAGLAPGDDAVAVEKMRYLARFWISGDGQVTAVQPVEPWPGRCEFEVTAVRAMGHVWWTACFEAFGAGEAKLEGIVLRVAARVLAQPHPLTLDTEHSLSYPQWLARVEPAL